VHPAITCVAELKNCATSKIPAEYRCAINVTGAVRLQIGIGVFAFSLFKAIDHVRRCCGDRGQREGKNCSRRNASDAEISQRFH
jgi:hypothetical protein